MLNMLQLEYGNFVAAAHLKAGILRLHSTHGFSELGQRRGFATFHRAPQDENSPRLLPAEPVRSPRHIDRVDFLQLKRPIGEQLAQVGIGRRGGSDSGTIQKDM